MPAGRPTKYKPEYSDQARKICTLGATDEDIAVFFEVDRSTVNRWKISHQEFCDALKAGKSVADDRVERSLYERANGYTHDEDKIFMHEGQPVVVPTKKHYPPDTTAAIFWLKNRRPDEWRDKRMLEQTTIHNLTGMSDEELMEELDRVNADIENVLRQR